MDIEIGKLTFHQRISMFFLTWGFGFISPLAMMLPGSICAFSYENTCHFQVIETDTHLAV